MSILTMFVTIYLNCLVNSHGLPTYMIVVHSDQERTFCFNNQVGFKTVAITCTLINTMFKYVEISPILDICLMNYSLSIHSNIQLKGNWV